MKVLKIILIIVVILAAVVAILHAVAPKELHVERTITIEAPYEVIHAQITSLKNHQEWSPWAEKDPDMTVSYEGTDGEVGSISKWEGNKDVGKGSQEITSITDDRVETKLTFVEPYPGVSFAFIQLNQGKGNIDVSWGFDSENAFPMTVMGFFIDFDAEIGKDFDKGLAYLKDRCEQLAEASPAAPSSDYEIVETQWEAKSFIVKREEVPFDQIGQFFGASMPGLGQVIGTGGYQIAGTPCALYYSWDEEKKLTDMAVAIPVVGATDAPEGYELATIDQSKAIMIALHGSYDKIEDAHYALNNHLKVTGLEHQEVAIEEYVTDPSEEPDTSKWLTNIYYLIK